MLVRESYRVEWEQKREIIIICGEVLLPEPGPVKFARGAAAQISVGRRSVLFDIVVIADEIGERLRQTQAHTRTHSLSGQTERCRIKDYSHK